MRLRRRQARRMDPPAFEDRHPLLDPQQRLAACRAGPAGTPPSRRRAGAPRTVRTGCGWAARAGASARPVRLGNARGSAGPERAETAPPATRDKPLATQLTTFLFYFCSCLANSTRTESMARLGALPSRPGSARFPRATRARRAARHAERHMRRSRSRPRLSLLVRRAARRAPGRRSRPARPDRQRRHRRLVRLMRGSAAGRPGARRPARRAATHCS